MTKGSASVLEVGLGLVLVLVARTKADFVCTGTQLERRVCLPTGYTKTELPTDNVEVDVNFGINYFTSVDDSAQTFSVNMYLSVQWTEPRLLLDVDNFDDEDGVVRMSDSVFTSTLWHPDLFVTDLVSNTQSKFLDTLDGISVDPNGTLTYFITLATTISCKMNFGHFPFDKQTCRLLLSSSNFPMPSMVFNSTYTFNASNQRSQSFSVTVSDLDIDLQTDEEPDGTYSQCGFTVTLQRYSTPYLLQYYVPCCGMVIVSWISFLINLDVIPGRVGLLITLFLVLTTMFGSIQTNTPKSFGLTALGVYALACLAFVFAAMIEFAFVLLVKRRFLERKADDDDDDKKQKARPTTVATISKVRPRSGTSADGYDSDEEEKVFFDTDNIEEYVFQADKWWFMIIATAFLLFNIIYIICYSVL